VSYIRIQDLRFENAFSGVLFINGSADKDCSGFEIVGCEFAGMNALGGGSHGAGIRFYGNRGFNDTGINGGWSSSSGTPTFSNCFAAVHALSGLGSVHNLSARNCKATGGGSSGLSLLATDQAYIVDWVIENLGVNTPVHPVRPASILTAAVASR
jgi:hypothetical protein